ncbi:hypothetical protein [Paraferrimonas haliotis]|uniref:hypothetical protein n=1 Tax=Paraferrimonas haliotis TaxID=2013866 RepID=UPI000BA8FD60|nr:hypothetical protein [Paraferrimonas haliotis]
MKKLMVTTLAAAITFGLAGCSDDTDTSALEQQIADLQSANSKLEADKTVLEEANSDLTEQNGKLQEKAVGYISNFQQQCAEIGEVFEYVNPNPDTTIHNGPAYQTNGAATLAGAPDYTEGHDSGMACTTCHTTSSLPSSHSGYTDGTCTSCHSVADPTDPDVPGDGEIGAPGTPTHPESGEWKTVATGASGNFYYNSQGASFVNAKFLETRFGKMFDFYEWQEVTPAASSVVAATMSDNSTPITELAQACKLPGREHLTQMFPNDGKQYQLAKYSNFKGIATISTVSKVDDGQGTVEYHPNTAIFGPGMKKDEASGDYFINMFIVKNNTCKNVVEGGEARIHYVEFDPRSNVKLGSPDMGPRNSGARLIVETDYKGTSLSDLTFAPIPGFGAGDDFKAEDVNWSEVGACNLSLKVDVIAPLG